ncbi:MAG: hypothetical protein QNJ29_06205 [Rhizobiaceae bacterium]|nr:hypothetical protein [Rhizobiaceae bacterium]
MKVFDKLLLLIVLTFVTLGAPPSFGQGFRVKDCIFRLSEKTTAFELVDCLRSLAIVIEDYEFEIDRLKDQTSRLSNSQIPSGAVLAFDLPAGCPAGWRPYLQAAGRTIVGSGNGNSQGGVFLSERRLSETGGQEKVALDLSELPKHSHGPPEGYAHIFQKFPNTVKNPAGFVLAQDKDVGQPTERHGRIDIFPQANFVGGGRAHENMPPFLVLHYCRKE